MPARGGGAEGCMFSSLNFDLYFTDLYRRYNMKDCARRPLTTYSNDFASIWKFDAWCHCISLYFGIFRYFLSRNMCRQHPSSFEAFWDTLSCRTWFAAVSKTHENNRKERNCDILSWGLRQNWHVAGTCLKVFWIATSTKHCYLLFRIFYARCSPKSWDWQCFVAPEECLVAHSKKHWYLQCVDKLHAQTIVNSSKFKLLIFQCYTQKMQTIQNLQRFHATIFLKRML